MTSKKFENILSLSDWEIETDNGFKPLKNISKTIQYDVWYIRTTSHELYCADDHILFDNNNNQVYVKDLKIGNYIQTDSGIEPVLCLYKTDKKENMYDTEVDSTEHSYYSNGIKSHNTTITVCFLLWYVLFHSHKAVAVLANKGSSAMDIVGRIETAYINLPKWIQQGVSSWNKGSFQLENGSSVVSAATSSDAVRGRSYSCVTGDTMITVLDDSDKIYYIPINKCEEIKRESIMKQKKYYYVYKVTNNINNKEYIGFHSTNDLNDGYMGSGKLIIKAIEKYGIENFSKEILKIFDNKKDAEDYERKLVNEEYVMREDTYNISIGGNVCILHGKFNGFYGKKHTKETLEKIQNTRKKNNKPINYPKSIKVNEMKIGNYIFNSYRHASNELELSRCEIDCLLYNNKDCYFLDKNKQESFEINYRTYLEDKKKRSELHWKRVSEYMKSDAHKLEVSKALSGSKRPWVANKINKDPNKIAKTAEKHRGMKRSEETRKRMSEAQKKKI